MKKVYYKYTTTSWTQPILTSNSTSTALGTIYTSASAVFNSTYAAWRAMDGGSDYSTYYDWAVPGDQTSGWWKISFPYKLKISNILFIPREVFKVYIYTDESKSNLIAELGDGVSNIQTTNIPVDIVTDSLYIEVSGNATVGIAEITLTADRITGATEGTPEDYDYYTTVGQAIKENVRKYYKYLNEFNGTQYGGTLNNKLYTGGSGYYLDLDYLLPLGTANNWEFQTVYTYNGGGANACVLGTTTVAPTAPVFGHIVDNEFMVLLSSDGTSWGLSASKTGITAVTGRTYYFKFGFTGSEYYVDYNIDGSDNYTRAWTLNSSQKAVCTSRAILMNNGNGSDVYASSGTMDLSKTLFIINNKIAWRGLKSTSEGATSLDYDFYKDVDVYKSFYIGNKYKA